MITTATIILAMQSIAILNEPINYTGKYLSEDKINEIFLNNPEIKKLNCLKDKHIREYKDIKNTIKHQDDYTQEDTIFPTDIDFYFDLPLNINFAPTYNLTYPNL